MRTRISVALNGIELHSIDEAIVLQGVDEEAPNWNISTGNRGGKEGQFVNSIEKRFRSVTVSFAIAEKRDLIRRNGILQQVFAWAAAGGDLTVSYRDGQKLRVICTGLPAVRTLTKWAEAYSIQFRAYDVPYWQSTDRESVTAAAGTAVNTSLSVRGSAGGKLCFSAANSSGSTVNTFAIAANGRHLAFESLGLANGETLVIDYDDRDLQRIRILGSGGTYRSAMAKRTITSNDDVLLHFGANAISMTSDAAVALTAYTYGRWE